MQKKYITGILTATFIYIGLVISGILPNIVHAVGDWLNVGNNIAYTNGNVGVGTSNPLTPFALNRKLGGKDVGITQGQLGGTHTMEFTTADTIGNQATRFMIRGGADYADTEFYNGARGAEYLNLMIKGDTGNVGIKTSTPKERFQVGGTKGVTFHDGGHKAISWNSYYDTAWRYMNDDFAGQIQMDNTNDKLLLQVAPSGTTGNVVTWKSAISISSDGEVCIGACN